MNAPSKPISCDGFLDHLTATDVLDTANAERVRAASESSGAALERVILELGLLAEETVFKALADYMVVPFITVDDLQPDLINSLNLDPAFLERVSAVPVDQDANGVLLATTSADSSEVLKSISFFLGKPVQQAITCPSTVQNALAGFLSEDAKPAEAAEADIDRLRALANDGPIVKYVNEIIAKAVSMYASDIHFEAQENGARIRFRVDGGLIHEGMVSTDKLAAVVSRVKVMSDLNISEKRRPQDGRITTSVRGRNVDIRVSTLPTQFGESIVMRLLNTENVDLEWSSLGFEQDRVAMIRNLIGQPNGIFLVAGPTGSGKTTTLYTALKEINQEDRKIVTVEDPIEYSLQGVNQTQVDPAINMTFAQALRAILRQDPDIIMVGEIRDQETAQIAVRAALVGRLVLSTVHTNDSVSAITRLIDLGVPGFMVASTLRGVLSQRLVRRICQTCGGAGGDCCSGSGAKGRQVISELLVVGSALSECISNGAAQPELQMVAQRDGFTSLDADAHQLLNSGVVTEDAIRHALGTGF